MSIIAAFKSSLGSTTTYSSPLEDICLYYTFTEGNHDLFTHLTFTQESLY